MKNFDISNLIKAGSTQKTAGAPPKTGSVKNGTAFASLIKTNAAGGKKPVRLNHDPHLVARFEINKGKAAVNGKKIKNGGDVPPPRAGQNNPGKGMAAKSTPGETTGDVVMPAAMILSSRDIPKTLERFIRDMAGAGMKTPGAEKQKSLFNMVKAVEKALIPETGKRIPADFKTSFKIDNGTSVRTVNLEKEGNVLRLSAPSASRSFVNQMKPAFKRMLARYFKPVDGNETAELKLKISFNAPAKSSSESVSQNRSGRGMGTQPASKAASVAADKPSSVVKGGTAPAAAVANKGTVRNSVVPSSENSSVKQAAPRVRVAGEQPPGKAASVAAEKSSAVIKGGSTPAAVTVKGAGRNPAVPPSASSSAKQAAPRARVAGEQPPGKAVSVAADKSSAVVKNGSAPAAAVTTKGAGRNPADPPSETSSAKQAVPRARIAGEQPPGKAAPVAADKSSAVVKNGSAPATAGNTEGAVRKPAAPSPEGSSAKQAAPRARIAGEQPPGKGDSVAADKSSAVAKDGFATVEKNSSVVKGNTVAGPSVASKGENRTTVVPPSNDPAPRQVSSRRRNTGGQTGSKPLSGTVDKPSAVVRERSAPAADVASKETGKSNESPARGGTGSGQNMVREESVSTAPGDRKTPVGTEKESLNVPVKKSAEKTETAMKNKDTIGTRATGGRSSVVHKGEGVSRPVSGGVGAPAVKEGGMENSAMKSSVRPPRGALSNTAPPEPPRPADQAAREQPALSRTEAGSRAELSSPAEQGGVKIPRSPKENGDAMTARANESRSSERMASQEKPPGGAASSGRDNGGNPFAERNAPTAENLAKSTVTEEPGRVDFTRQLFEQSHEAADTRSAQRTKAPLKAQTLTDMIARHQNRLTGNQRMIVDGGRLGELDVRIEEQAKGKTLHIYVENESARQEVQKMAPAILNGLQARDIPVAGVLVDYDRNRDGQKRPQQKPSGKNITLNKKEEENEEHSPHIKSPRKYGYNTVEFVA